MITYDSSSCNHWSHHQRCPRCGTWFQVARQHGISDVIRCDVQLAQPLLHAVSCYVTYDVGMPCAHSCCWAESWHCQKQETHDSNMAHECTSCVKCRDSMLCQTRFLIGWLIRWRQHVLSNSISDWSRSKVWLAVTTWYNMIQFEWRHLV